MTIASHPLVVDPALALALQAEATRSGKAPSDIASEAIARFLEDQQRERDLLQRRLAAADVDGFIPAQEVMDWIDSWSTNAERSTPVAGRD